MTFETDSKGDHRGHGADPRYPAESTWLKPGTDTVHLEIVLEDQLIAQLVERQGYVERLPEEFDRDSRICDARLLSNMVLPVSGIALVRQPDWKIQPDAYQANACG